MTSVRPAVTIVSPHFDDVPLSLGQSLRDGALARCDVTVRVVFGRTNWTTWVHPTERRAWAVGAWRRVEESLAGRTFGYRVRVARFREALLRTGDLDPDRLLDPDADLGDEPLVAEVADWLAQVVEPGRSAAPELVLVPAGIGGHVDHRIVALAAVGLVGGGRLIGFYEDRPYAAHLDPAQLADQVGALGGDLRPVAVSGPVTEATQRRVRRCYPSQMDPYFLEAMDLDRRRGARERAWFAPEAAPGWLVPSTG